MIERGGVGGSSPRASAERGGVGGSSPRASTERGGVGGSSPRASTERRGAGEPSPEDAGGGLRERLLVAVLSGLARRYAAWTEAPGGPGDPASSGLRAEYLRWCDTVGRDVRVLLPGDSALTGRCTDIDQLGRLVVTTGSGPVPVTAGDVIHVR
ncbi:MAG: hypothetical protein J2P32_11125 [Actinobacteria bacterium]|nr:hypothetical protein [Actinomycetota bacterium]